MRKTLTELLFEQFQEGFYRRRRNHRSRLCDLIGEDKVSAEPSNGVDTAASRLRSPESEVGRTRITLQDHETLGDNKIQSGHNTRLDECRFRIEWNLVVQLRRTFPRSVPTEGIFMLAWRDNNHLVWQQA